jgi:hypothetical protein
MLWWIASTVGSSSGGDMVTLELTWVGAVLAFSGAVLGVMVAIIGFASYVKEIGKGKKFPVGGTIVLLLFLSGSVVILGEFARFAFEHVRIIP